MTHPVMAAFGFEEQRKKGRSPMLHCSTDDSLFVDRPKKVGSGQELDDDRPPKRFEMRCSGHGTPGTDTQPRLKRLTNAGAGFLMGGR